MLSILRRLLSKNPVRNLSNEDRNVLAICIGAAFVFWLILNLSDTYTIQKEVDLRMLTAPERVLVGELPDGVTATIEGSGWNLIWESFRTSELPVVVSAEELDGSRLTASTVQRLVNKRLANGNLSSTINNFNGATVLTTPKEGKRVPVVPRLQPRYRPGFYLDGPIRLTPDSITLSGSQDVLDEIEAWPTAEAVVEDVHGEYRGSVDLADPPPGVELSRPSVRFELAATIYIQRRLEVPIEVLNPTADSFRLVPAVATVEMLVPEGDYGDYGSGDVRVVADIGATSQGELGTVPLRLLRRPENVIGARVKPLSVEYVVYRR